MKLHGISADIAREGFVHIRVQGMALVRKITIVAVLLVLMVSRSGQVLTVPCLRAPRTTLGLVVL